MSLVVRTNIYSIGGQQVFMLPSKLSTLVYTIFHSYVFVLPYRTNLARDKHPHNQR
jgi:hypothetical protein